MQEQSAGGKTLQDYLETTTGLARDVFRSTIRGGLEMDYLIYILVFIMMAVIAFTTGVTGDDNM